MARKRNSVTQQWEDKKPERPKKPAEGFQKFASEFSKKRKRPAKGENLRATAAAAWKDMDDDAKNAYSSNAKATNNYNQRLGAYKQTIQAMKRPAEPYALFVQKYWQTKKPKLQGKGGFGKIQKVIAKEWWETPEEKKKILRAASTLSKALFKDEQKMVLDDEKELNVHWKREGCNRICRLLSKKERALLEDNEDDVDSDDADDSGNYSSSKPRRSSRLKQKQQQKNQPGKNKQQQKKKTGKRNHDNDDEMEYFNDRSK